MTFSCQYASHSSSATSSNRACRAIPTLFTRTSSPPSAARGLADRALGLAGGERSADDVRGLADTGRVARPHVTTRAPSATSWRAISRPIPPVEPVTRQRLPPSPRSMARLAYPPWRRRSSWSGTARPTGIATTASRAVRIRRSTTTGRAQARALATELRRESVRRRVHEPAPPGGGDRGDPRSRAFGLEPIRDGSLMEVDVGSWSGLTRDRGRARYPEGFARWLEYGHGWDDGETYDELGARVVSGLLTSRAGTRDDGVLAVTHGGPIRSALAAADGRLRSTKRGARSTSSTTARSSGSRFGTANSSE